MFKGSRLWSAVLLTAAFASAPAFALTIPGPCGTDEHVRCAVYDPNEVYEVGTTRGKVVLVQFEPGETVEDNGAGIGGEPKAWAAAQNKNWIVLQPDAPHADTNLVVVTNRRTYALSLVTASKRVPSTWVLRFDYPDTRARLAAEAEKKATQAAAIARSGASSSLHRNEAYSMRGDVDLAPTAMWDDGRFTYFQYATGRDLPRVFQILADGSEAQTNFHMDADTIVVHSVAKAFVVRLGNAVLGIRNDAFAPDGQFNARGTTVPDEVRITKEQK